MSSLKSEWPGFSDVPEDDVLHLKRPEGQELARWIWWDGEVREADRMHAHYYANALHYGTAVFEGIRVYPSERGAVLVRLRDHMDRLLVSARVYGMRVPYTAEELIRGAIEVTRKNGITNGYLRPLVFFGRGPIDLKPKRECPVHAFVAARALGTFLGEGALRNGVRVTISSWKRIHHSMLPTFAKASGHYASSVLAAQEAADRGFDDAILLNHDGTVACATGMNVFVVRGGVLVTNDERSSIIPGITRDCILTLAKEAGVPVEVRTMNREDLLRADEVLLTGTAAEVTPVRQLDGIEYRTGRNTLGARLQRAYLRAVTGKSAEHFAWLTQV